MGLKLRLIIISLFTIIGLVIIYNITNPNVEVISLIDNYKIVKKSDTNIKLIKDKQEIITDYIGEYGYGKRYILLKCLDNKEGINIIFYIIDTKDDEIHGPYKDYETFKLVQDEIVDEKIDTFIKTIK